MKIWAYYVDLDLSLLKVNYVHRGRNYTFNLQSHPIPRPLKKNKFATSGRWNHFAYKSSSQSLIIRVFFANLDDYIVTKTDMRNFFVERLEGIKTGMHCQKTSGTRTRTHIIINIQGLKYTKQWIHLCWQKKMFFLEQDWVQWHFPDYGMEPVSTSLQLNVLPGNSHYSKSQIFVQKFNFDKTPTFSRVFHPQKIGRA